MQRMLLCALVAVATFASEAAAQEARTKQLITAIDCTQDYGPEKYFGLGEVRVVRSAAGSYREAGAKAESRFGYRFAIRQVGRPHLAVIRYPDDKTRSMSISDGTCYDLSIGIFTGAAHPTHVYTGLAQPTTGRMLEIRQVFWPRWTDCSIVFGNTVDGEPAAAASVAIYELEDLPSFPVPGDRGDGSRRQLGIQYEDPCGRCGDLGALTFHEWLDRMVAYARYSGQTTLTYPILWYHGPFVPSQREPVNYFDWSAAAGDRKLYIRWTTQPPDWVAELLERFGRERLAFTSQMSLIRLGSLMQRMNLDLGGIKAGRDTINNMLFNDQVQTGSGEWTIEYNIRNFARLTEFREAGKPLTDFPWAYGEKRAKLWAPIFNPLHPVVQEAVLGTVEEIAGRYARYPAYKGIDFFFWPSTILWFGSLKVGYDDYTVGLFQKETGITVPVDAKAPDRFSRRYAFLTGKVKPQWVAWRCAKIRDLFRRMRDVVVRARRDLRVTITVQSGNVYGNRDGGLDLALLAQEPGIDVNRSYSSHQPPPSDGPEAAAAFRGVWIFNAWIERWGKHKWFRCDPHDPQTRQMATLQGRPADGVCRMGSEYPPDGFWWDSQLRITPAYPGGVHFLQPYAHALAEYDARAITRGGLALDKGHAEWIRPFALAYRALPAKRFETVGGATDPVAVRTLVDEGRQYLYLVNREYYPIAVEVRLEGATCKATNLATSRTVDAGPRWAIALGPYELQSYALPPQVQVTGFTATPPAAVVAQLKADAQRVLDRIAKAQAAGKKLPPGIDALVPGIRDALRQGRLAALRRALESKPIVESLPQP